MKIYLDDSNQQTNPYKKTVNINGVKITNEADCMKQLVKMILARVKTVAYDQDNISNQEAINRANSLGCTYYISYHSNANNGDELQSTDIYYHDNSEKGKALANKFASILKKKFQGRVVNVRSDSYLYSSGLQVLRETNMPAILIENFWHDSYKDLDWYARNHTGVVEAYVELLNVLQGINPPTPLQLTNSNIVSVLKNRYDVASVEWRIAKLFEGRNQQVYDFLLANPEFAAKLKNAGDIASVEWLISGVLKGKGIINNQDYWYKGLVSRNLSQGDLDYLEGKI